MITFEASSLPSQAHFSLLPWLGLCVAKVRCVAEFVLVEVTVSLLVLISIGSQRKDK